MIIRDAAIDRSYFHLTVSRKELEALYHGISWTIDQMEGVDNVDLEKEVRNDIGYMLKQNNESELKHWSCDLCNHDCWQRNPPTDCNCIHHDPDEI